MNEEIGRAVCAALNLDPDQTIPMPPDPMVPAQSAVRYLPRWAVAAELAERHAAIAAALAQG